MFDYLKWWTFQAKVQAELKAQCKDQKFTNLLCHGIEYVEYIDHMSKDAYFKLHKVAPFVVVCVLLGKGMEDATFSEENRRTCAFLLAQRLEKVNSNRQFRQMYPLIFGELEEKLASWVSDNVDEKEVS